MTGIVGELQPSDFNPMLIGQVVSIQVFRRTGSSETIDTTTLVKYVGTLQTYVSAEKMLKFRLVGETYVELYHSRCYFEVYELKKEWAD